MLTREGENIETVHAYIPKQNFSVGVQSRVKMSNMGEHLTYIKSESESNSPHKLEHLKCLIHFILFMSWP